MEKWIRIVRRIVLTVGAIGTALFLFASFGVSGAAMAGGQTETALNLALIGALLAAPLWAIGILAIVFWAVFTWIAWAFELEYEKLGLSEDFRKKFEQVFGVDFP